ncbi:metabotropic glycine receptor [Spinachia spinachia]
MGPVWLLLLVIPALLRAQVTPGVAPGPPVDADNSTGLSTSSTGTSKASPSRTSRPTEPPSEDDWSPAETFLYTRDPLVLEAARCSRAYSPPGMSGSLPASFGAPLRPALDALANAANFLNMIFQASDLRESTVQEDMEWYHALVRALLEGDPLIRRALLTFDADPTSSVPQLVLCASRNPTAKVQTIVLQDLSKAWESLHPPAPAPDDSWFRSFKFPESNQPAAALSKRVLLNDLSTLDTPKWRQGDSYVTDHSGVRWGGSPFLDCEDGLFLADWMLTLSTSFYGLKPDLTPEFRGVIRVDVNIQDIDLDQCATGDGWFADTHQCNRTSMECVPSPGQGFQLGQYCCRCKEGYYDPETSPADSDGGPANRSDGGACYPNMPICLPCWPGCGSCRDGAPCRVQEAWLLRAGVLALQGFFMLLIFVSMLVAYRHRRSRRIRASGLLLLEMILFGSLLLYFPVFIMYFRPSTFRCILLRWVRMLGFSIVYGTVTLKMYRVLKVFLSRTAQRVPYMSGLHLLRILGVMLMTVSWFLCAWTVGVLQNRDRNIPVFVGTSTWDGQGFNLCHVDRWDYMMAVAELLFLCWGSSLWSAVRPVPSAFHEPRYMGIAIHNELLLSSLFHLFRFTFPSLHPDWMLLLSFTHTHVTITVTLALLFVPKFLFVSKPGRAEIAAEVYEEEVDLRRSGSYLNSSFRSAWSEHTGVDPEDFRDELRKLYAQLEVHKTKKMTANNPHLSKKRSSRCALGRSIIRRIAEIPENMSRRCSRDDRDGSFHSRMSANPSESFRRTPDNVTITYKSSMKSPSMCKSQSDHHYVRDPPLRHSMLKEDSVKRLSQSETDSLDIPPGVCKSASAQNLSIDTNLLHPDHTRLHKTWSLTSATTHSMENLPKVSRSKTVLSRSRQSISISDQTRSALQLESFDKAEVCPWEVAQEQSGDKNQKHVTYANSEDGSNQGPQSPQALVCPWDHFLSVEKNPSEDSGQNDSPKPQVCVSASAPGTPRAKVPKDQRLFSFRGTSTKWLAVKAVIGSFDSGSRSSREGSLNEFKDSVSQKSQESTCTTPRSGTYSRRPSREKKSLQKRSMTTVEKPCLVKQNAVRLSSGDSTDRSPRKFAIGKSGVYPWDVEDVQRDGTCENVFLSRQNSRRSSTSSWETASSWRTPSTHRRGSNRITPVRSAVSKDVCPWDGAGAPQEGGGLQKQHSIKADVCAWEPQPSNVCPWELQEQGAGSRRGSGRVEACPWESQDIPVISYTNTSRDSQGQRSLKRPADVCPWETAGSPQPSLKQDNELTHVCPWDAQVRAEVVYENLNPLETKGTLSVPLRQEVMKPAVHPGVSKDILSNEQHAKYPSLLLGKQMPKAEGSCPWDFPDPPKFIGDICPWDENTEPTDIGSTTQINIKVDTCPQETGHQDKPASSQKGTLPLRDSSVQTNGEDSTKVNICPWKTAKTTATSIFSKGLERPADVCPWDSAEPESGNPQTPKTSESPLRSLREDVCPWNTEESKVLQKQDSTLADVCPWETEEPKVLQKQDKTVGDVCPWETEEPKILQKQESTLADVCPWETEEPMVLQKQEKNVGDICPWETEEPKVPQEQQKTVGDICPWETEEPKVLQRQDSTPGGVCPWESDDPQTSTRSEVDVPNSEQGEVPENQGPLFVEGGTADISPEQIDESKQNLVRQNASCAWDMRLSQSGSFTDNATDVFTWEPENIPEEEEEDDAECAAEAFVFPSDL